MAEVEDLIARVGDPATKAALIEMWRRIREAVSVIDTIAAQTQQNLSSHADHVNATLNSVADRLARLEQRQR